MRNIFIFSFLFLGTKKPQKFCGVLVLLFGDVPDQRLLAGYGGGSSPTLNSWAFSHDFDPLRECLSKSSTSVVMGIRR
jgi:hypothetical protein